MQQVGQLKGMLYLEVDGQSQRNLFKVLASEYVNTCTTLDVLNK